MVPKPVLILQNTPLGPAGLIAHRLAAQGQTVETRLVTDPLDVPTDPTAFAGVIVLGGTQSAWEDAAHPTLPRLRGLIRSVAETGVPYLGVCLGAQLAAMALGGSAYTDSGGGEHGFCDVEVLDGDDALMGALPPPPKLMQSHFDTFTVPERATRLARSPDLENQGFRFGPGQYAFQFHFEVDGPILAAWQKAFAESGQPALVEQAEGMGAEVDRHLQPAMVWGAALVDRWAGMLQQRADG